MNANKPVVPVVTVTADNGETVTLPRWQMNALLNGAFNRIMSEVVRSDSAASKPGKAAEAAERDKPPPAADAAYQAAVDRVRHYQRRQHYKDLYARLDAAEARCDAAIALRDAEEKYTAADDDVDGMTKH
jgi:hypothetical protein